MLGHTVQYEAEADSTNRVAKKRAVEGVAAGWVVVADFQTAGRGRHGRTWDSARGKNLLMSLVLRPPEPVSEWGRYVMAAGLAVCQAVDDLDPTSGVMLKWPNDILVGGRKCGGMLMEHAHGALVLGLGLNVNQTDFPDENRISLALALGRPVDRERVFHGILKQMEHCLAVDVATIPLRYAERLIHTGQQLSIRSMDGRLAVTGLFLGVTPGGALRLRVSGQEETFHAGDVTMVVS